MPFDRTAFSAQIPCLPFQASQATYLLLVTTVSRIKIFKKGTVIQISVEACKTLYMHGVKKKPKTLFRYGVIFNDKPLDRWNVYFNTQTDFVAMRMASLDQCI